MAKQGVQTGKKINGRARKAMLWKKQLTAFVAFVFAVIMLMSSVAYAHSGRTDSRGGHKDNKNKSGLGSYHYHCGGYPAHLHNGGVCPYKSPSKSSSTSSSSSKKSSATKKPAVTPAPTATLRPTKIVDGVEIPAYDFPIIKGTKDDSVKDIQTALIDMGYLDDVVDGIYGNKTENALIAYCDAFNMSIDQDNLMDEFFVIEEFVYDGYFTEEMYVQIMKDYMLWQEIEIATQR